MNGVTGRIGTNQHLIRSVCAIRKQGGIKINDGEFILPDPILVGRNEAKLNALAKAQGIECVTLQVDGTMSSAVAGLRDGVAQHHGGTPRLVWNPDIDSPINFYDNRTRVPAQQVFDNVFKMQWEIFLHHVVKDEPWQYSLLEGAKGVQLAEKGLESWARRAWVDVPELKA